MSKFAQALTTALGYCIVSHHIIKGSKPIGFVYKEKPVFEKDTGWRFFSGDELDEYTNDTENFSIQNISEITKTNPSILSILDSQEFCAWEINSDGGFDKVEDWTPTSN